MKVLVVAEFYPRVADPALGIWAHRQALAARDHGAEVRVVVLHRPIAPAARFRDPGAWRAALSQPGRTQLDGLDVRYLRSSRRRAGAATRTGARSRRPALALELRKIRREFPYDLVHAHYAVPAADARAARARPHAAGHLRARRRRLPHRPHCPPDARACEHAFPAARIVLANSMGIERACRDLGAQTTRVVHLGTDLIPMERRPPVTPTLVTVGQLIARKRQADVLRAMWILRDRHPDLRYRMIGDGPERDALALTRPSARHRGARRVHWPAAASPRRSSAAATRRSSSCPRPTRRSAWPTSRRWRPGCPRSARAASPGPEDIASLGHGMRLVPPGDPEALAREIDHLLDADWGTRIGAAAPGDRGCALHLGRVRRRDRRRLRGGHRRMSAGARPVLLVTNLVAAGPRGRVPALHDARTSSSPCSAAAPITPPRPSPTPASRTAPSASARSTSWPPRAATAR